VGETSIGIVSYLPQRIELSVEAKDPPFVTPMTAWPGWKLTVDGGRAPLVSYNHAFLGFRLARGRHAAVLRSMPDSFVAGSVVGLGDTDDQPGSASAPFPRGVSGYWRRLS